MAVQHTENDSTDQFSSSYRQKIIAESDLFHERQRGLSRVAPHLNMYTHGVPSRVGLSGDDITRLHYECEKREEAKIAFLNDSTTRSWHKRYNIAQHAYLYERRGLMALPSRLGLFASDDALALLDLAEHECDVSRVFRGSLPCCRHYMSMRRLYADCGVSDGECIECVLNERVTVMRAQMRVMRLAAQAIYKYGPFLDLLSPIDESTILAHFEGDELLYDEYSKQYCCSWTKTCYSLAPLGLLTDVQIKMLVRRMRVKMDVCVIQQLCTSEYTYSTFMACVREEPNCWARLRACLRRNHPSRAIVEIERLRRMWTEIRKEISEFDVESRLDAIANADLARLREKYKKCVKEGCERDAPVAGGLCVEHMTGKTRSGEAQFFNAKVDFPPEVLEFLRRLAVDEPLRARCEFAFSSVPGMSVSWPQLVASVTSFATIAYRAWPDFFTVTAAFSQLVLSLRLDEKLAARVIESFSMEGSFWLGSMFAGDSRRGEAQLDDDALATHAQRLLLFCVSSVMTLLSALFVGKMPPNGSFMNFMKNMGVLGRSMSGMRDLAVNMSAIVTAASEYFRVHILGLPPSDDWKEIDDFCEEVAVLKNSDFEKNIKNNIQLKEKVDSLIQRGDRVLKKVDRLKMPMTQRQRLSAAIAYLNLLRTTCAGSGAGCTEPRVAPIIVHIVGASGTGKSTVLWLLIARLLADMGCVDPNDVNEKVFFKYPTKDERWDGFSNATKIVVCDDVFARRDSEANPSPEVIETIRMSNTAFWQLTMAHLHDKGTTFFKAPVVLWTSNKSSFHFESITNPEAVQRRVTVRYRQYPHPDYARVDVQEGEKVLILDQEKVFSALSADRKKLADFVLFDKEETTFGTRVVLKKGMTFAEVAEEVCMYNRVNLKRFASFNDSLKEFFLDEVAKTRERLERERCGATSPESDSAGGSAPPRSGEAQIGWWGTNWVGDDRYNTQQSPEFECEQCVFFQDESVLRNAHVNVWESAKHLPSLNLDPNVVERTEKRYVYRVNGRDVHLSNARCVTVKQRKLAPRFIKAWATALYVTRVMCPDSEVFDGSAMELFDSVFWQLSQI